MPHLWSGGECQSNRRFSDNKKDKAGKEVWKGARTGVPIRWNDLDKAAPEHFSRNPNSKYKTFMTCGILDAAGKVRGMLNVDAPQPRTLAEVDYIILHLFAVLMGVAETLWDAAGTVDTREGAPR